MVVFLDAGCHADDGESKPLSSKGYRYPTETVATFGSRAILYIKITTSTN